MKIGTTFTGFISGNQELKKFGNTNDVLSGIIPTTESIEHSGFNLRLDNIFSRDFYSCKTVIERIEEIPYVHASTGGPG